MIEVHVIPRSLIDTEGHMHLIELLQEGQLLLDGEPTSIEISQETIQFQLSPDAIVSCSASHFWHAFAGAATQPTAEDAGSLLASLLIQQATIQRLVEALHTLKSSLNCALTAIPQAPMCHLPVYHVDPLIEQALEIYDGNPETTQILARLLKQPAENIIAWATLLGKTPTPANTPDQQGSEPPIEIAPSQEGKTPRGSFRWTAELVERLKNAFSAFDACCPMPTTAAKIQSIAQEYQWPLSAVHYKVYELGLPRAHHTRIRETGAPPAETEGDQSWSAATTVALSSTQGGTHD